MYIIYGAVVLDSFQYKNLISVSAIQYSSVLVVLIRSPDMGIVTMALSSNFILL